MNLTMTLHQVRQRFAYAFTPYTSMNGVQAKHPCASASAEQDITRCAVGPSPPPGMKISTVVFSAHTALDTEWLHIGPLCHNLTLSCDTGGGLKALPICAHNYISSMPKNEFRFPLCL